MLKLLGTNVEIELTVVVKEGTSEVEGEMTIVVEEGTSEVEIE